MTLPRRCPNCGAEETLRRETANYGTPKEFNFVYCTRCPYNAED